LAERKTPPAADRFLRDWLAYSDKQLFGADPAFDRELAGKHAELLEAARAGELDGWEATPEGALALVLVLDQLSRNLGRGTPDMYASDAKALAIAKRAIARGLDREVPAGARRWFYMPFMHSEDLADQEACVELCRAEGLEATLPYALEHAGIVRRFGRFPHRNRILGRPGTPEEDAFLEAGGSAG
jgi:uncharacterized protein (DUF924 family)